MDDHFTLPKGAKLTPIWPPETDEEKAIRIEMAAIFDEYQRRIEPYQRRLAAIHDTKVPRYIIDTGLPTD
jgi:hypothetical protein